MSFYLKIDIDFEKAKTYENIQYIDEYGDKYVSLHSQCRKNGKKYSDRYVKENGEQFMIDYDKNGIKMHDYRWNVHGVHNGVATVYYPDGSKSKLYNYKNGNKNGESVEYWQNGNVKILCNYKNRKLDGKYIYHWKNGNKKMICYYEEKHGDRFASVIVNNQCNYYRRNGYCLINNIKNPYKKKSYKNNQLLFY